MNKVKLIKSIFTLSYSGNEHLLVDEQFVRFTPGVCAALLSAAAPLQSAGHRNRTATSVSTVLRQSEVKAAPLDKVKQNKEIEREKRQYDYE